MSRTLKTEDIKGTSSGSVFVHTWGKRGPASGQFNEPRGIAVGSDGMVYVTDSVNQRIQCFDPHGVFIRMWGQYGNGDGEFKLPLGLSVAVCRRISNEMKAVPELAGLPPGLLPICVAYVGDERIAVADSNNDRIQIFQTDGEFICKWGSSGIGDGQFNLPYACVMTAAGIIYVVDTYNRHCIQCFESDGIFLWKWGYNGIGRCDLDSHTAISVDESSDMLYICDTYNHRVLSYKSDGTFEGVLIFLDPVLMLRSILVENNDNTKQLFVCNVINDSVGEYRIGTDKTATLIRGWGGGTGHGDGRFNQPTDIAKGRNGTLYVVDCYNNRIVAINSLL